VIHQRTSVGLDVHARSVFGCALDGETGEIVERRMTPEYREIVGWMQSLPGPVSAV
jgi:transposase